MLTFYVLTQTGQVVSRSSVERVKEIEKRTDEKKRKLEEFDMDIKLILKFDDLGTDGDKPDPHQWADLLDVDTDFREEQGALTSDKRSSDVSNCAIHPSNVAIR
jgi:hypothetical protein